MLLTSEESRQYNRRISESQLLLDDGLGDVRWHFHVLAELHRESGATLAHRAHRGRVTEHLRQWHFGRHGLARGRVVHTHDLATTAIEVADHIAHVFLGRDHLDLHDRLEDDGFGAPEAILEAEDRCHAKRDL